MVMIGIDPHKRTRTAVAIDTAERVLDERFVWASCKQVPELLEWVKRLDGGDRIWPIESAGGLGYLLAQQLLAAGEHVVDIPATLASRVRLLGTGRSDKNDPERRPLGCDRGAPRRGAGPGAGRGPRLGAPAGVACSPTTSVSRW
jgi:transposase